MCDILQSLSSIEERLLVSYLRGKKVDQVEIGAFRGVGIVSAAEHGRRCTVIRLRQGRTEEQTLLTFCHEIGHFWSYATLRRTPRYQAVIFAYQRRVDDLVHRLNNDLLSKDIEPKTLPLDEWQKAYRQLEQSTPGAPTGADKNEIISEEWRAWCFASHLAAELHIVSSSVLLARNEAMQAYSLRLEFPWSEWSNAPCLCDFRATDEAFVRQLTSGEGLVADDGR